MRMKLGIRALPWAAGMSNRYHLGGDDEKPGTSSTLRPHSCLAGLPTPVVNDFCWNSDVQSLDLAHGAFLLLQRMRRRPTHAGSRSGQGTSLWDLRASLMPPSRAVKVRPGSSASRHGWTVRRQGKSSRVAGRCSHCSAFGAAHRAAGDNAFALRRVC